MERPQTRWRPGSPSGLPIDPNLFIIPLTFRFVHDNVGKFYHDAFSTLRRPMQIPCPLTLFICIRSCPNDFMLFVVSLDIERSEVSLTSGEPLRRRRFFAIFTTQYLIYIFFSVILSRGAFR